MKKNCKFTLILNISLSVGIMLVSSLGFAKEKAVVEAAIFPIMEYQFELSDFSFDLTGLYEEAVPLNCSSKDLKKAVVGKLDLFKDIDDSKRYLIPSFDPALARAAWKIHTEKSENNTACEVLAPYFNGIGLSAFNIETGQATIYVASFLRPDGNRKDNSTRKSADAYERLDLMFNPQPDIFNLFEMPAHCELVLAQGWKSLFEDDYLVCSLDDDRGELRLVAHPRGELPMSEVSYMLDNSGLLYGDKLKPPQ